MNPTTAAGGGTVYIWRFCASPSLWDSSCVPPLVSPLLLWFSPDRYNRSIRHPSTKGEAYFVLLVSCEKAEMHPVTTQKNCLITPILFGTAVHCTDLCCAESNRCCITATATE